MKQAIVGVLQVAQDKVVDRKVRVIGMPVQTLVLLEHF